MSQAIEPDDNSIHELPLKPLLGLYELQHDFIKLNLAASAEMSRRTLQLIEHREPQLIPDAPMQVLSFYADCFRLTLSPMTLMAAAVGLSSSALGED